MEFLEFVMLFIAVLLILFKPEKEDSSGICVGSSSPDFGQREPVNKYGESPR